MTTMTEKRLRELLLGDVEEELEKTRRALERVPEEQLEWRPHERSMSLGELSTHLANLPFWPYTILAGDEFDTAKSLPKLEPLTSRSAILAIFEERAAALRERLATRTDADLMGSWKLRNGPQVVVETTRAAAVRSYGISHMIHHRGQLTVYLRLLGTPVPGLYGPSADER